jgi:hypothetical protein
VARDVRVVVVDGFVVRIAAVGFSVDAYLVMGLAYYIFRKKFIFHNIQVDLWGKNQVAGAVLLILQLSLCWCKRDSQ